MDTGTNPILDQISRRLLAELQKDARISFAELGRRVGLSPSATAERVRRLEDDGTIRGYRIDIDPTALGLSIIVYVRMTCDGEKYRQFLPFVKALNAVRECYHVTGSDALIMKVLLGSIDELEDLILKFLPFGSPTTSLVLSQPLGRTEYSLETPKPRKFATMRK